MALKIKSRRTSKSAAVASSQQVQAKLSEAVGLHRQGKLEPAIALYSDILRIEPRHFDAIHLLGVIADQMKNHQLAVDLIDQAIAINSSNADAYFNRGNALKELGRLEAAIASYDKAILLNPRYINAYGNRGIALQKLGRLPEAVASYDKAIGLAPDNAPAHYNRGLALQELGQYEAAIASYDKAIGFNPHDAGIYNNRGNALMRLGRVDDAVASYEKVVALYPNDATGYFNLGGALGDLRRLDQAVASYDKAIALKPDFAEAFSNRGVALKDNKQLELAVASYDRAIALKPEMAEAYSGRAGVYKELGQQDKSFADFDHAYALAPDFVGAEGSRLHARMFLADWANFAMDSRHLAASIADGKANSTPFAFLSINPSAAAQLQCATSWIAANHPAAADPTWRGEIYAHGKIRLGFVSADYREHPVADLVAGVLDRHDRSRFELVGISIGPNDGSAIRKRLESACDIFIDAQSLSDTEIAGKIRQHEIDILNDLTGFTEHGRTGLFALRPAPVQVNNFGYPGTMGAGYYDYMIGDPIVIPAPHRPFYREKIVYMPHTYLPNDYCNRDLAGRAFSRAEFGLPDSGVVFCAFNNGYKINPFGFRKWMEILKAVDGSVLWLTFIGPAASDNLREQASGAGVSPDRLVFAKRMPSSRDHLARHRLADLFLDAMPYNAHTTACDALWAGLPVITQIGESFAGRVAASLLNAIGLPELVTPSREAYESLAIELANDPARLCALKAKLAANLLATPLFDTAAYTRHIEAAYQAMAERYRAGGAPDHIFVHG
jgi:predicted O-linked N-acetylglucosamine transferase (SPINDLY family)